MPGLVTVFFSEKPVRNFADATACDLDAYGAWCRALLARGVYAPASQFEAWFVSLAHDERDLEWTIEAATAAFSRGLVTLEPLADAVRDERRPARGTVPPPRRRTRRRTG